MSLRHWLQLSLTDGIGPILARRLIDAAGGIEAACEAPASLLRQADRIGHVVIRDGVPVTAVKRAVKAIRG